MSLALQLAQASQEQHRRYHELFGSAPVSGDGWQDVAARIRAVAQAVDDLHTAVVSSDFSTTVLPNYVAATRTDTVPFTRSAEAADVFSGVTDSSAKVNVDGANAIADNASAEAADIAAIPNPDSPEGLATILGIIHQHQARSAAIFAQSAATEQALGQQAANAGGTDTEADDSHVQLVDHLTFPESPIPSPLPDPDAGSGDPPLPASELGLPAYDAGSLSAAETRTVYLHGELRMRELNERLIAEGLSPEQRARVMFDQRNALRRVTRLTLAITLRLRKSPRFLRSSVTNAIPFSMDLAGFEAGWGLPRKNILPSGLTGEHPKTASMSSVRPEPISPARPSISPRRSEKETSRTR